MFDFDTDRVCLALEEVKEELKIASQLHPPMRSCHEGFAILLEEVDELKQEVWKKPKERSLQRLRSEALQVCAMALRFVVDLC